MNSRAVRATWWAPRRGHCGEIGVKLGAERRARARPWLDGDRERGTEEASDLAPWCLASLRSDSACRAQSLERACLVGDNWIRSRHEKGVWPQRVPALCSPAPSVPPQQGSPAADTPSTEELDLDKPSTAKPHFRPVRPQPNLITLLSPIQRTRMCA